MTGQDLRRARKGRGWTQQQTAKHLGVSQGYLSMIESDHRPLPAHLVEEILNTFEMSPLALPLHGDKVWSQVKTELLATQLAALGYPGFSYMEDQVAWNPAELLVVALAKDDLEPRVAAALPWLVLRYHDLDWEWLVREAKLLDVQNRLGFTVTLARELAERKPDAAAAGKLRSMENLLQRSKLAQSGTYCNERMSHAEKVWLLERSTPEAQLWNMLSDLSAEHLADASTA